MSTKEVCRHHSIYEDHDDVYRCCRCHIKVPKSDWEYEHGHAWDD